MTDRLRPLTSPSGLNTTRHRSHSSRERTNETASDLDRKAIEQIARRFEQELVENDRELQLTQHEPFLTPQEYLRNIRVKIRNDYNQLMQEKVDEVEKYMNERCNEERRLSQRKLRKIQIENEQYRLDSIQQIVRERDAICEEKLATQRSLYNRLLNEQAQRLHAEQNLQSFEGLNIEQLKDRLTRVESTNSELKQLIINLLNRKPIYKSTLYLPNFVT